MKKKSGLAVLAVLASFAFGGFASAEEVKSQTYQGGQAFALARFRALLMFGGPPCTNREVRKERWMGKMYEISVGGKYEFKYEIKNGSTALYISFEEGGHRYTLIDQGFDGVVDFGVEDEASFLYQKERDLPPLGLTHFQRWQDCYKRVMNAIPEC